MAKQIDLSLLKSMIRRRNFEVILVALETSKFQLLEPLLARETWENDERDWGHVAELVKWLRENLPGDQRARVAAEWLDPTTRPRSDRPLEVRRSMAVPKPFRLKKANG